MNYAHKLERDFLASIGLLAALSCVPFFVTNTYWLGVLVVAMYFGMLAAGWNLQIGFTGQVSLAPTAFAMIGGYTTGIAGNYWGLSHWLGIPLGTAAAAIIGMVLGIVVLRLRGVYLALTTLAFAEVSHSIILNAYDITNGQNGLPVTPIFDSRLSYFYLFLGALTLVQCGLFLLMWSKAGLYLQAIRDDEIAARARGIRTVFWKVISFTIAAMISGLAGALYAHYALIINPDMGVLFQTGLVITMVILGGVGSLFGPLFGALLVYSSTEWLRDFGGYHLILYSLLVIIVARYFRAGLFGFFQRIPLLIRAANGSLAGARQ